MSPTPIIGRDDDIRQVITLLDRDDLRVVTLLGPGGVGKTRIAQTVASSMAPSFAHGACFVALEGIRDPALVPGAIAQALSVQITRDYAAAEQVTQFLADRHVLLVLDNLEHVLQGVTSWLPALVQRAPRIRVLGTSRIPLHITDEQHFVVPPLPVGEPGPDSRAAVILFRQRAQAVNIRFVGDDSMIEAICRRLDGLPLAIELAAARMNVLSPEALLARLTDRLTVLTGGHHDTAPRLQSMHQAIGWSYDLLSPVERALFRRLSVFVGGFSLQAAEFVAAWPEASHPRTSVLDTLHSLVEQNLVQVVSGSADNRFRMLEPIREYGVHQIETGDEESAYRAHAAYYCSLAENAESGLQGPDQSQWHRRLEDEFPNIRSATTWLENHDRLDEAIHIFQRLMLFFDFRGYAVEALLSLERWVSLPALRERHHSWARAAFTMGVLQEAVGEFQQAAVLLEEAGSIFRDVGDTFYDAWTQMNLGAASFFQLDLARSRHHLEAAVGMAREHGHYFPLAAGLNVLSGVAWTEGDHQTALRLLDDSAAVARRAGNVAILGYYHAVSAQFAMAKGRLDDSEQHLQTCIRLRKELGSRRENPSNLMQVALIARQRGDLERAARHLDEAVVMAQTSRDQYWASEAMREAGVVHAERGDLDSATTLLAASLRQVRDIGQFLRIAPMLSAYVVLAARAGDSEQAARFLGAAMSSVPHGVANPEEYILDPANEGNYRSTLESSLGVNVFHREYQAGSVLTMGEAIDEALAYRPSTRKVSSPQKTARANLSPRERDVLLHMANGMSNQQIADELFVSHRTVTTHVSNIMTKLDVPSRTAAVSFAIRNGMA